MVNNVFVSYAREDAIAEDNLVDRFLRHGKTRVRSGEISIFKDTEQINFGDEWRKKIDEALDKTDIAILMISVNFLDSDFIFEHELRVLLDKHRNDGVRILPVLLGHCDWENEADLEQFQIFPDGNEPLNSMNENTFEQRAVEFFRTILPQNYRTVEKLQPTSNNENYDDDLEDSYKDLFERSGTFESEALKKYEIHREDVSKRYYTVEEAADLLKVNYKDVYTFLSNKGYSKPIAFMKTPWFLTVMQMLEIQNEFQLTTKLDENQIHELFKKYHPNNYQDYQSIFNTFLHWGNESLINKNSGTIYWGQNTTGNDLGSVGWIYWKDGRKTSKYKYFLFRISAQGLISPSFWWNTQNYSNDDKKPFNNFEFQSSILEKFARIGIPEFGATLNSDQNSISSIKSNNAFTKRDNFVDLSKLSDKQKLTSFLSVFDGIIEHIDRAD
jgi:hypothetical protein